MNMIPFSPPFIDDDVLSEVADSLKSGWITTGPKTKALEVEIARIASVDHTLCVNSATSGLMLVLKWFGVGPGDEVIVPSYTYCATALAVYHLGATPIMVDVKSDFTVDPDKILAAISSKTKVIIPVDIAGWPSDYDAINKIVCLPEVVRFFNPNGNIQQQLGRILVMSDAAHSIGAFYNSKPTGSLCDITVFSLHAVKNVTTAEGGAIAINLSAPFISSEVYAQMRLMCLNGQTKDAFTKTKAGGWRYDIILPGFKMNMPDVCAAIGLAQIRKYGSFLLPERKRVAEGYYRQFCKYSWAQLPLLKDGNTESSYHLFALRIKGITETQRDAIIDEITLYNIAVNVHFIPMPMLTIFKDMGYDIKNHPIAYDNYSREISLPIYPQLSDEQVDYIVDAVINSYNKVVNK